ncbi:MAG: NTP transferase domain-containing protein, partial [Candidatus Nitrotoga sp.]
MNNLAMTTVILAGGAATRMGGDKGLQLLHGRPLIDWVLDNVRHHSAEILLNVNADNTNYLREGCRTIKDI